MHRILAILPISWWICLGIFVIHQLVEKIGEMHFVFLDNFLDPFLSIPIILGIHLTERRIIFGTGNKFVLPIFEALFLALFLALLFEYGFPAWFPGFVSDPFDFIAYGLGLLLFILFINKPLLSTDKA